MSQRPRRHSGFVLVFVLVLLLLAGFSAAGFARKSLELARTVADQQEGLQRRWGLRSCQRFALANANSLLDSTEALDAASVGAWPLPNLRTAQFDMGGLRFEMIICDEDSKINLNALVRRGGDSRTLLSETILRSSVSSGLTASIRSTNQEMQNQNRTAFQTWEQVFDLRSESDVNELVQRLQMATIELTCWGSGKLNLRRASDNCVRNLCAPVVSSNSISLLLEQRRTGGFRDLEALLSRLKLKNDEASALRFLTSIESRCYAMWATVRSDRRSWNSFTIDRSGKGNPSSFETFYW